MSNSTKKDAISFDGGVAESRNAPVAPGEVQGSRPAASVEQVSAREAANLGAGIPESTGALADVTDRNSRERPTATTEEHPPQGKDAQSRAVDSPRDRYAVEHPHGNWHVEGPWDAARCTCIPDPSYRELCDYCMEVPRYGT